MILGAGKSSTKNRREVEEDLYDGKSSCLFLNKKFVKIKVGNKLVWKTTPGQTKQR